MTNARGASHDTVTTEAAASPAASSPAAASKIAASPAAASKIAAGRPRGAGQNARQRARAQITREIKEEARRQLAAEGAQRLSLRAVARELGMVSSALYRYFPSRDDLLTALIIDAYDSLGTSTETAVARWPTADARGRWRACCHAIRDWAIARPHEYALIYGSPVPGYQAPQETIAPAARVAVVIGGLLSNAWPQDTGPQDSGPQDTGPQTGRTAASVPGRRLPGLLAGQAEALSAAIAPGVPPPVIARTLIAWTQLFGMISFELFGQLIGSADPSDDFFSYAIDQMADLVGLPA
jgi:AcrR family transcriptional regulator